MRRQVWQSSVIRRYCLSGSRDARRSPRMGGVAAPRSNSPFWSEESLARIAETRRVQHISDFRTEPAYLDREPGPVALAEAASARTVLMVPMVKEGELIGVVTDLPPGGGAIHRQADRTGPQLRRQSVIAIENTRLLNELRELLQQQTATADVLKVISRSTFDLQTVLDALVEVGRPVVRSGTSNHVSQRDDGGLYNSPRMSDFPASSRSTLSRPPVENTQQGDHHRTNERWEGARSFTFLMFLADPESSVSRMGPKNWAATGAISVFLLLREGVPIGVFVLYTSNR